MGIFVPSWHLWLKRKWTFSLTYWWDFASGLRERGSSRFWWTDSWGTGEPYWCALVDVFMNLFLKMQLELRRQTASLGTPSIYISNRWPLYKLWRFCNHVPNCCLKENQTSCLRIEIFPLGRCGNQHNDLLFFCFVLFVFRLLNSCLVFFFLLRAGEYHACF